jgi:indolepyruvate decarboxylase
MEETERPYTIADYIFDRLVALGARHLFTVPGNYCAEFLLTAERRSREAADDDGRLACIGTTNEMEAGYAADAYARLRGIGVVCVTYGVGSFSLLNAVAGAYVERCPVVVLNGTANARKARMLVQQGVLFAHAIDQVRTDESVFRSLTAATTVLTTADDAPAHVDRVLRACVSETRPVYLEVADGVWTLPCPRPSGPLVPLPTDPAAQQDIEASVAAAVSAVMARLREAEHPVLWGGEELQRRELQDVFEALVEISGVPYTTTLLGKSLISEANPHFVGVYDSVWAPDDTKRVVEGADCLLALGTILSDFYGRIVEKSYDTMILAAADSVRVGRSVYPNVPLVHFVSALLRAVCDARGAALAGPTTAGVTRSSGWRHSPPPGFEEAQRVKRMGAADAKAAAIRPGANAASSGDGVLTWESFFQRMHRFVEPNDVVLADTSLVLFPAADLLIPQRSHFMAQTAWLSIGFTLGAAVGASMAIPAGRRVVVFAGDGGLQMLPQTLSTLARQKKPAIIFVMDNGLYGIEQFLVDSRYFQEPARPPVFFNELARWDYVKLAEAFHARGFAVGTSAELELALHNARDTTDAPVLIAVALDPRELPPEIARTLPPSVVTAPHASFASAAAGGTLATVAFD